jgi:hypothetical protein
MSIANQVSESPQQNEMGRMKATVHDHVQRDLESVGTWSCMCADCGRMRSLIGVEKMVEVRPLVREIAQIEEQLAGMPEGAERRARTERYLALHDRLADVMAT